MVSQMLTPKCAHRNELSPALLVVPRNEATLSSVLPNRKTRAGRPPGVHHLKIRPRFRSDPFEQIEDQRFDRIRRRRLSGSDLRVHVRMIYTSDRRLYFSPSTLPLASRRIASFKRLSFVSSRLADSIQAK